MKSCDEKFLKNQEEEKTVVLHVQAYDVYCRSAWPSLPVLCKHVKAACSVEIKVHKQVGK